MDIFIARQGIYNRKEKIIAYELLYRSSFRNRFDDDVMPEEATYKVIENISSFGLEELTDNKKALVNFTEKLINSKIATLLPKERIIIEVLENVNPTSEVISNLQILRKMGYKIALDDVIEIKHVKEFINVIDIIKVDYMESNIESRKEICLYAKQNNKELLAEKIETEEELREAKELGFDYFQGYYYSKPSMLLGKDLAIKNSTIFSILVELFKEDYDIDRVEMLIKTDVAISYKFLKFINSSYFNFMQEINSIKQAISLIGKEELKKWLSILSVVEMTSNQREEYTNNTVVRAKLCEFIMENIDFKNKILAFMVGLFSNLNIIMEQKIEDIVEQLPLNIDVKNALVGEKNLLRDILDLVLAYENMEVEKINDLCGKINIEPDILSNLYIKAIEWTKDVVNTK